MSARILAPLAIAAVVAAACGYRTASTSAPEQAAPEAPSAIRAQAGLKDAKGDVVGLAEFVEQRQATRLDIKVLKLAPGKHGIHVHAEGKCDAPAFTTAGGHFNPAGKKHGLKSAQGPHAGDLENLEVKADGTGQATYFNPNLALATGASQNVIGKALLIHAGPDDETTDPAGNSGDRIACGIITRIGG